MLFHPGPMATQRGRARDLFCVNLLSTACPLPNLFNPAVSFLSAACPLLPNLFNSTICILRAGILILRFYNYDARDWIWRFCRHVNGDLIAMLSEREFALRTRQQVGTLHSLTPGRYAKAAIARPVEDMQINTTWFAGCPTKVELFGERARSGTVYRFAVLLHPLSDLSQPFDAWSRNQSLGSWSDIQQIIAPFGRDVYQVANNGLW